METIKTVLAIPHNPSRHRGAHLDLAVSLESLLESLLERAQNLVFPTSPLLAPSFVFFFFFFFFEEEEEEEEEEADWPPALDLAPLRLER
jgi:hypothetical protein